MRGLLRLPAPTSTAAWNLYPVTLPLVGDVGARTRSTIQLDGFHCLTNSQTRTEYTLREPTMGDTNNRQPDYIEDRVEDTPQHGSKMKQEGKRFPKLVAKQHR